VLGSRQAIVSSTTATIIAAMVLLPDLFSSELDTIADDIQVVELAKYTEIVLLPR